MCFFFVVVAQKYFFTWNFQIQWIALVCVLSFDQNVISSNAIASFCSNHVEKSEEKEEEKKMLLQARWKGQLNLESQYSFMLHSMSSSIGRCVCARFAWLRAPFTGRLPFARAFILGPSMLCVAILPVRKKISVFFHGRFKIHLLILGFFYQRTIESAYNDLYTGELFTLKSLCGKKNRPPYRNLVFSKIKQRNQGVLLAEECIY